MSLFEELKRRNVIRVALAYVVTAWLLAQVADVVLEAIAPPEWVMQVFLLALAMGFPLALVFAWAFEITPEGIKLEKDIDRDESITHVTGRKLDFAIIALLAAGLGYFVWESRFKVESPEVVAVAEQAPPTAQASIPQPASSADKSIAVLPFVNLSSDPEQEYFSDGISEELLNVLAQFPDLRVAARTSSFQFKGDNRDISEIARLLKVAHVLEGSVRKAGTRLRITAQLIEADNGYHLWSQTYDRELKDVFAIQDEISAAIGEAMKAELALQGAPAPKVAEASNTGAYEAYLKGRQLINHRGNLGITEARRQLEKSIRLDPNFAPAQAQLAIAITLLLNSPSTYGDLTLAEINELAPPHIHKALELNPDLPEAHGALALLEVNRGNLEQSLVHSARAVELNPAYVDVINWRYNALGPLGRYREAADTLRHLLSTDPLSVVGQLNWAANFLAYKDKQAARDMCDQLVAQYPWAGHTCHGQLSFQTGAYADALEWTFRAYGFNPADRFSNEIIAVILASFDLQGEALRISDATIYTAQLTAGNYRAAREEAERLVARDPNNPETRYALGSALVGEGNRLRALDLLEDIASRAPRGILRWPYDTMMSMINLAYLRQQAGDREGAETALALAEQDLRDKEAGYGTVRPQDHGEWAMLAAVKGDIPGALEQLRKSIESGNLDPSQFHGPVANLVTGDPGFAAIQSRYRELIAAQRELALELICLRNPIPEDWQPLPETCASVVLAE